MENPLQPVMNTKALKDFISTEARRLKHFMDAEKALASLESIEQSISEKTAALEKLKNAEAEAIALKENAKKYAESLQKDAVDEKRAADAGLKSLLEDAKKAAAKIVNDAKAEAKALADEAEKRVAKIKDHGDQLDKANSAVTDALTKKRDELESVTKAHGEIKAKLQGLM